MANSSYVIAKPGSGTGRQEHGWTGIRYVGQREIHCMHTHPTKEKALKCAEKLNG